MELRTLGRTGIVTTVMGIGTLTMSPVQRGLSEADGGKIIWAALQAGIRLIDTAQMYGSYPQVRWALREWHGEAVTVISKSAARTAENMTQALDEALSQLEMPRIDGFLLHGVRDPKDFDQRRGALEVLQNAKERGVVRAIGISSHFSNTIAFAGTRPEIDLLHPIFNRDGFGILDVPLAGHFAALRAAKQGGKGIYAMKPLGGGHLCHDGANALRWLLSREEIHCFVVGMSSEDEVRANVDVCSGREVSGDLQARIAQQSRRLFVNRAICTGCGNCVKICDQKAIHLVDGKAVPDPGRCVLCGYCAPGCPAFALRVI